MIQEQHNTRVTETMFCFIVQWLNICESGTANHKGDGGHVLIHSTVVEHL